MLLLTTKQQSDKYLTLCVLNCSGNNVSKKNTPYQQGTPCSSCPGNCDNGLCTNTCEYEDLLSNCDSLKKTAGCEHELLKEKCKATCLCEGKIHCNAQFASYRTTWRKAASFS